MFLAYAAFVIGGLYLALAIATAAERRYPLAFGELTLAALCVAMSYGLAV